MNIIPYDLIFVYDKIKENYHKHFFSDEQIIKKKFKHRVGRNVELINPKNFTDKLQWLKLHWHDPLAAICADKYEVRKFVEERIGSDYLNVLYNVYESVEEINVSELPKSFVLKGTHGSGFNIICKDKDQIDWTIEFNKMRRWLKKNYYWTKREWVYKDIKPRIVSEQYLSDGNLNLTDYKFFCFNGKPFYCQVIRGRGANETIDFYDTNWEHMPFVGLRLLSNSTKTYSKPAKYDEMLRLAECLSYGFPFVRVDFYLVQEKIHFGELTFFPLSGMGKFKPGEWDRVLGDLLDLPMSK